MFTVDGARPSGDAARVDAGAKLVFRTGQALFANLTGEWSNQSRSYAATAGYRGVW